MGYLLIAAMIGLCVYLYLKSNNSPSHATPQIIGKLDGTGKFAFDIVGESHYQDALEQICGGRTEDGAEERVQATLYIEDDNPHDKQAVRVDIEGRTVGYLSRGDARSYRKQIGQTGHPNLVATCEAKIVGGWDRGGGDSGHFGVKLDLPVA